MKRVWTDEQRAAAAERCRQRFTKKPQIIERTSAESSTFAIEGQQIYEENVASAGSVTTVETPKERAPEVQAVIDGMDPQRKAKLAAIQARNMAQLSQTKEGREALDRLEARRNGEKVQKEVSVAVAEKPELDIVEKVFVAPKPVIAVKVPFRFVGQASGLMISEFGTCLCGAEKLKWHKICVKGWTLE